MCGRKFYLVFWVVLFLLSFSCFSEVILTDQEYSQIETLIKESIEELETSKKELERSEKDLSILKINYDLLYQSLKMQKKEAIVNNVLVGVLSFSGGYLTKIIVEEIKER